MRPVVRLLVAVGGPALLLAALVTIFAVPGVVVRTGATVGEELAFTTVAGREAVLFAYETEGFGELAGGGSRVAAVDVATGETLWDEELPDIRFDAAVIAAGRTHAYVRHGHGLEVIAVADGSVVASAGDGDTRSTYRYDRVRNAIVAVTRTGAVRMIPLDGTSAVPADRDVTDTWSCVPAAGPVPTTYDQTTGTARTVTLRRPPEVPDGLPLHRLSGPRATDEYVDGAFLMEFLPVDPPRRACPDLGPAEDLYPRDEAATGRAVVTASGHAVIQSRTDLNADDTTLTVVALDTGRRTATVASGRGYHRALTAPSGRLVIVAPAPDTDVLYLVDARGSVRTAPVGERGWFGVIDA